MTIEELKKLVGREYIYTAPNGLRFYTVIADAKKSYGRDRIEIMPMSNGKFQFEDRAWIELPADYENNLVK